MYCLLIEKMVSLILFHRKVRTQGFYTLYLVSTQVFVAMVDSDTEGAPDCENGKAPCPQFWELTNLSGSLQTDCLFLKRVGRLHWDKFKEAGSRRRCVEGV